MSIREKIEKKNLPHGIHIMEPDNPSGSEASEALEPTSSEPGKARLGINGKENPAENPTSWSYLFLQHMAARNFLKWLKRYKRREVINLSSSTRPISIVIRMRQRRRESRRSWSHPSLD